MPNVQHRTAWPALDVRVFGGLADFLRFRCSVRTIVPVLGRADVRHSPLPAVPPAESVHVETPEPGSATGDDESIRVPNVDAECATHGAEHARIGRAKVVGRVEG